jgi:PAS domain S-box-containing protein
MHPATPTTPLIGALEQLRPHDHLCSIYESQEEQFRTAMPFVRIGLERGEKCIYIADDANIPTVRAAMYHEGIDVDHATRSNALALITKEQTYLRRGTFDPDWMFTFWQEATEQAKNEGFAALRATGETEWVMRGGPGLERWMEYESRLTHTLAESNCFALCQYNRRLFPSDLIRDVIRTHPTVIYGDTVCENFYHVPPEEFLGTNQTAREVERLLTTIQERDRVEYALREQRRNLLVSEQRFRLMVEGVKDYAIFMLDTAGRVTSWNVGAERLKGYGEEEILGQHFSRFYPPEGIAQGKPDAALRLAAATGSAEDEDWRVRKDGSRFWADVLITAVRDEAGELISFSKVTRDITERRLAEDALQKMQAELTHVTRAMTMGELAASIAHEVNQPLAAIVTSANACQRWLAREVPDLDEARAAAERISRDGHRASDVIQRLRALAKRSEPQKTRLDLNEVIDEVVTLMHSEMRLHGVALRMELSSALLPVLGDRVQVQQVLLNLLMNGIEAMRPITDRPREMLIRSRQHDVDTVLVAVQDAGIGLDPQQMARLFDAFFTTKPEGMGLGLSISRTIIEAHGGRLWATPNTEHGATVQFSLPTSSTPG